MKFHIFPSDRALYAIINSTFSFTLLTFSQLTRLSFKREMSCSAARINICLNAANAERRLEKIKRAKQNLLNDLTLAVCLGQLKLTKRQFGLCDKAAVKFE